MVVGWQAADDYFLTNLSAIPHEPRMLICSGGEGAENESEALADRLGFLCRQSTSPPPLRVWAKDGFGQLVAGGGRRELTMLLD